MTANLEFKENLIIRFQKLSIKEDNYDYDYSYYHYNKINPSSPPHPFSFFPEESL